MSGFGSKFTINSGSLLSAYFERAGFAIGFMTFFVYFIAYSAVKTAGHIDGPEFAELVDVLVKVVVASVGISFIGSLLQAIMFRELEPLAQQAVRGIVTERN